MQAQKIQEMQAQAQANAQSAQAAEGARQQTAQIVGQIEMQKQQLVNQGLVQKEQVKGNEQRQTIEAKFLGDFQIAQLEAGAQVHKTNTIEDRKDQRSAEEATRNSKMIKQRKEESAEPIDFEKEEVNNEIFEL